MPQPEPMPAEALVEVYVQPGESHLVTEPSILRTVLGSCVGVAFWAPQQGAAALCHPMLPRLPVKNQAALSLAASRRYVDFAICDLARQFDRLGVSRAEVQVKLFGGGDVLLVTNDATRPTVGKLNYEMAIKVLRDEGFDVVASSLGGTSGLHIQFNSVTGEVLLRRLN